MKQPLLANLQDIRDALDDFDRTPFGDTTKLLDKMTTDCDHAIEAANRCYNALVSVCGELEDAIDGAEESQGHDGWVSDLIRKCEAGL